MCNYVTGIALETRSEVWRENLTLVVYSPLLTTLTVRFEDEDDNRGSGR
jgi:hypothetical protein